MCAAELQCLNAAWCPTKGNRGNDRSTRRKIAEVLRQRSAINCAEFGRSHIIVGGSRT